MGHSRGIRVNQGGIWVGQGVYGSLRGVYGSLRGNMCHSGRLNVLLRRYTGHSGGYMGHSGGYMGHSEDVYGSLKGCKMATQVGK